jgi:hypothetical protein
VCLNHVVHVSGIARLASEVYLVSLCELLRRCGVWRISLVRWLLYGQHLPLVWEVVLSSLMVCSSTFVPPSGWWGKSLSGNGLWLVHAGRGIHCARWMACCIVHLYLFGWGMKSYGLSCHGRSARTVFSWISKSQSVMVMQYWGGAPTFSWVRNKNHKVVPAAAAVTTFPHLPTIRQLLK